MAMLCSCYAQQNNVRNEEETKFSVAKKEGDWYVYPQSVAREKP